MEQFKPEDNSRRKFLKNIGALSAGVMLGGKLFGREQQPESFSINRPYTEAMPDHNMPDGFIREKVLGTVENEERLLGSLFWFDDQQSEAHFFSNDLHPDAFEPKINYETINTKLQRRNEELVLAFAGAYRGNDGDIEGIAIEQGVSVGQQNFSSWPGFVYITPNGTLELYRLKDQYGNFDTQEAGHLVNRAKQEGGSLFQQISAIWDGKKRLQSSNPSPFEFRAIGESSDGRRFVLNSTEKMPLDTFLSMASELTDQKRQPLVENLMLMDTGLYSYGVFRDRQQIEQKGHFKAHTMIDEQFAHQIENYTNVFALSTRT